MFTDSHLQKVALIVERGHHEWRADFMCSLRHVKPASQWCIRAHKYSVRLPKTIEPYESTL